MTVRDLARCESCGRRAERRLADGSTWCSGCHETALDSGYDEEVGEPL